MFQKNVFLYNLIEILYIIYVYSIFSMKKIYFIHLQRIKNIVHL